MKNMFFALALLGATMLSDSEGMSGRPHQCFCTYNKIFRLTKDVLHNDQSLFLQWGDERLGSADPVLVTHRNVNRTFRQTFNGETKTYYAIEQAVYTNDYEAFRYLVDTLHARIDITCRYGETLSNLVKEKIKSLFVRDYEKANWIQILREYFNEEPPAEPVRCRVDPDFYLLPALNIQGFGLIDEDLLSEPDDSDGFSEDDSAKHLADLEIAF